MLNHYRHTDQLPVIALGSPVTTPSTPVRRLTPADFNELPYTPALLLPVHLDLAITSHKHYQGACKWGFDFYFEEMYERVENNNDLVFVEHIYTRGDVINQVMLNMKTGIPFVAALPTRVGVVLGMLSALALTDFPLAQFGLDLLLHLLKIELMVSNFPLHDPNFDCGSLAWPGRCTTSQLDVTAPMGRTLSQRGG